MMGIKDLPFVTVEQVNKLRDEAIKLERQLEEKTRRLAAYEAQPVIGAVSGGKYKSLLREYSERLNCGWKEIMEKPSTTKHLDALLAEAEKRGEQRGMEKAADIMEARAKERHGYDKHGDADAIRAAKDK